MKFDYCIGNPPYQNQKGGTKNVDIWPDFVDETNKICNINCLIHPGKWVVPKKYMKKIQQNLLQSGLMKFKYYPNSNDIFNNVSIDGGISVTLFKHNYSGDIYFYIDDIYKGVFNSDVLLFSNEFEEECYTKVFNNIDIDNNMELYKFGVMTFSDGQYGFNKKENADKVHSSPLGLKEPIKVWASIGFGKGSSKYNWYWIEKSDLINPPEILFSTKKVMIDMKGNAIAHGKGNVINNIPIICDKNVTGDKVYWFFPNKIASKQASKQDRDLELIKSLFMTKTARYLMCITQKSLVVSGFENIPDYKELEKLLPENEVFTDEWFYKTFNFSDELINEIETRVSPKIDK